jgi:exopolysaccharide biosynthesis polyprenyl glycosylphosphotransferase
MLADFCLLALSFVVISYLAALLKFAGRRDAWMLLQAGPPPISTFGVLLLYGVVLALLGHAEGLYNPVLIREPRRERVILTKAFAWATLLITMAIYFSEIQTPSVRVLTVGAPLSYGAMLLWRSGRRSVALRQARNGCASRNVLIVGAGKLGREVAACLQQDHLAGSLLRGFLDDEQPVAGDVRGRIEDLARIARAEFVDEIILAIPHQRDLARSVVREARRNQLDIKLVPDFLGFEFHSLAFETLGTVPVLTLHQVQIPVLGLFLKRVADVAGSLIGLLAAGPLLAAIALVIKLDSSGPVFYRAQRVGKKGRRFVCYKFRTMRSGADKLKDCLRASNQRHGPFFKIADDPRVTRAGRFLRRYSLDELPQLWNVLKGDMSLVGPRPHPLDDFEHYDLEDLRRLDVTPGITGLWQVTARRDPSFQRNMALDLQYIEQWSLWMDLRILLKTVGVVLQGSGV